ncbi:MAG: carboxypeptidase regulatory-like domain-containing protein [Pyrinomonadaceae bacterium]|nr:carboxypeptidase regulatory-like domain-containing protein [Pyrinomonadaceae bacterium]
MNEIRSLNFSKIICRKPNPALFIGILMLLILSFGVNAQVTTATLVGTISDPSGGQLPNVKVTARNTDTGLTRTVQTGEDGNYRIEFLPVGNYSIEVAASTGFKKAFRGGIVLQVNDTVKVDMALELGEVNETVTITDETPQINTSTAELGRTVQSQEIATLPLVERNVYALLDLTPGVQSNNTGVSTASVTTSNLSLGFPEQRTLINGGTDGGTGSVNYYLDGGTNMTNLRNTGNVAPNPEAIQEFKVTTNSYNAEYGRFASGVINLITKSGTNKFKGSLYEFVRNTAFNANDYGSVLSRAPYHRNQFGGSIGGPIKSDRTFFFFTYSGLRQITNKFLSGARMPTALERAGDFSQSATKPKDPSTGTTLTNATTFACNGVTGVICANRLDPIALKILNDFIPVANSTNPNGTPGWQGNVPTPYNTNEYLVKLDHQLTEAHRLSFTYFNTAGSTTVFPGSGNVPWATQNFTWRQHNVNLSDVWVISPDKVNQLWLTYTRNFGGRLNQPATSLKDLGSSFLPQGAPSLPQITVSGYFTLSNAIGGPTAGTNLYAIRNVLSWNTGKHSIKLGGELSLNKDIQETLLNNYGVFTFNNTATGNAFADFLLGIPSAVTQDAPVKGYTNTWYTALFMQDDLRATSNLTLNLGLRWEVQTPPTDPLNRFVNYVPGQKSTVNPLAPVGALFYGDPGVERGGIPVSYKHFSPRLGFAYDPFGDGKTSIRGAMGLFYGSISGNEWNTMTNFQPFSTRLTFTNINRNGTGALLRSPYNNYVGGAPFPYTGTFTNGGGFFAVSPDFEFPRTLQMNFSVQRQITKDLTVGVAYVNSVARKLPFGRDVNAPIPNATATTAGANVLSRRPNPAFGAVNVLDSDQSADYEGLQITGQMRLNKIFSFNGFYTLSKTTSSVELHNNTTQGLAQNYRDLDAEKGYADTDQRHIFSLSMNFQPDFYKGESKVLKGIFNGWSLSPIIKARSGRPFTVTNGNVDANLDGAGGTDRARLLCDPHLDNPTAAMWFNTACFAQNPVVTGQAVDGTSPRNYLHGPGYRVLDLALTRTFRFGERYKLNLRGEGTNVLNLVNLGQPNASVPATTSTTFGTISDGGAMRILQFGVRLTF